MKTKFLSLVSASMVFTFAACNSAGDKTSSTDSTTNSTTDVTTSTSTGSYAAQADSFRVNSDAGYYLNARTGKPIKIRVDATTGARIDEQTNEPVDYYVDKRTWWVYGDDSWDRIGTAKMEGDELLFLNDNDKWVTFDQKWKVDGDEAKMKSGDAKSKVEDDENKTKTDDGSKIKSDDEETKVK